MVALLKLQPMFLGTNCLVGYFFAGKSFQEKRNAVVDLCSFFPPFAFAPCRLLVPQDFLNGVCTNTVVMQERQMKYWGGNYDTFNRTKDEQDINQVGGLGLIVYR